MTTNVLTSSESIGRVARSFSATGVREQLEQTRSPVISIGKASIPKWLDQTTSKLYAILSLEDNWDSYGAKRISNRVADAATELLCNIMQANTPAPQVVPSANGSIQLEWHLAGVDLEIEVESANASKVFFEDSLNEESAWEGEISFDLTKLVDYISILTTRAQRSTH
ncbi:MAG: hypothetical protein Q8K07_02310 [Methylicorpusculum sp.]|uniref:hypothetical protein n=1 Tax=Methylicorpusculum sp. TaxID=2713644 RepID=UPI002731DBFF|nr:hypothetical protein [Methylicorpusculum sp.]MDP2200825.1 hypothetical protein [Methylicorpusculum sp.]